ncbi:MAG: G8 domain-containing protein [Pirellulales bacterium]
MNRRFRRCAGEALEARALLSTTVDDPASPAAQIAEEIAGGVESQHEHPAGIEYPGGVLVTDTEIITHSEVIPRFVAHPTISALRSGSWSDPTVWSSGHVPADGDLVLIGEGKTVSYSTQSNVRINAIEIQGRLIFSPGVNTRLLAGTITVMPTGTLQIGTESMPIASTVTAELVIADKPLDLVNDPRQYGTGLLVLGTITMQGAPLNYTWTRLAAEPHAGDTQLIVANPDAKWQPGDTLVLPDTRQINWSQEHQFTSGQLAPQWEEVTISRVVGNRVFLTEPLAFNHLGARDTNGTLQLLPHVAVLDRNVIVRSENPNGTRGHVLITARADAHIAYARFSELGRTDAFRDLDNTTFDTAGHVTHIGTNQVGRYAMHFHHLMGPENPANSGYQFTFVGNTVDGARKWGVAVHDTSYGLLDGNVVYDAQGAGFVTEEGEEIQNLFRNNITIRIVGTRSDGKEGTAENDYGRGGSGFWFRRGGNQVVGNVAADSYYAGFVLDGYFNFDPVTLPRFRGEDTHEPGAGISSALSPPTTFINNEAYGLSTYGVWAAYISGHNLAPNQPTTLFKDLRLWNIFLAGVGMYHTSDVTFRNLTIYGDWSAQDRNDTGSYGMYLSVYENRNLIVRDSRIEGVRVGIEAPRSDASEAGVPHPTIIRNTALKNYINIEVLPVWDYGAGNGTSLLLTDVKFELLTSLPSWPANPETVAPPANIQMKYNPTSSNITQPVVVKVINYNQVQGDDFQVYFHEQAPNFIVPKTDAVLLSGATTGTVGAPVAGLNNAQSWARYGIAIAGAVAPANAATRANINGLVAPLSTAAVTPRVVFVTPWDGVIIVGSPPVKVRYNVLGTLPANSWVWFSLDDGLRFTEIMDGGLFTVAPGWHTLRAWIGNLGGNPLPGTSGATVRFFVTGVFGTTATSGRFPQSSAAGVAASLDSRGASAVVTALALRSDPSAQASGSAVAAELQAATVPAATIQAEAAASSGIAPTETQIGGTSTGSAAGRSATFAELSGDGDWLDEELDDLLAD